MIEINTTDFTKFRTKGAKNKNPPKSIDQRRKEMRERMKADNTAQQIWDFRMGTDEDRARIDAEEKERKRKEKERE